MAAYSRTVILSHHLYPCNTFSSVTIIASCFLILYRYCALAPYLLVGRLDPMLFEALYVSCSFIVMSHAGHAYKLILQLFDAQYMVVDN